MSAARGVVRIVAPTFGLSPDRALVLALHRLEQSGAIPDWPLYSYLYSPRTGRDNGPDATLRNVYRKDS